MLFLSMHRFYYPHSDFSPPKITITDSTEMHHLKNVLRMKKGDRMEIFNGLGDEILGVIENITETAAEIKILSRQHQAQGKQRVILACAIPKKAKFEFIIEKATELGVDEIIPMQTARTEVIVKDDRRERKNARYQAVAVNAAKQSGRSIMPKVSEVTSFKDVIAGAGGETAKLIPCLVGQRKSLHEAFNDVRHAKSILFLIGPEGDFTAGEVDAALKAGFVPVSLGETTLKVDTAAITVVACARMLANS
jgi:16S rRNA (uracil1498-N3)-methyltransferase